jgi:hypothetical protein
MQAGAIETRKGFHAGSDDRPVSAGCSSPPKGAGGNRPYSAILPTPTKGGSGGPRTRTLPPSLLSKD